MTRWRPCSRTWTSFRIQVPAVPIIPFFLQVFTCKLQVIFWESFCKCLLAKKNTCKITGTVNLLANKILAKSTCKKSAFLQVADLKKKGMVPITRNSSRYSSSQRAAASKIYGTQVSASYSEHRNPMVSRQTLTPTGTFFSVRLCLSFFSELDCFYKKKTPAQCSISSFQRRIEVKKISRISELWSIEDDSNIFLYFWGNLNVCKDLHWKPFAKKAPVVVRFVLYTAQISLSLPYMVSSFYSDLIWGVKSNKCYAGRVKIV